MESSSDERFPLVIVFADSRQFLVTQKFLFPLLGFFLLVMGCRSPLELSSSWASSPLNIDGSRSDWTTLTIVESPPVSVAARNDEENLYLCLATSDPDVQTQVLFAGFTVWFPATHDGARPFGIQFPLRQDRPVRLEDRGRFEALFQAFEPRLNSLIILQGSSREQFSLLQAPGIRVRVGLTDELLVYELQVPLKNAAATPYAAVPTANGVIDVLFEASLATRDRSPERSPDTGRPARRKSTGRGGSGTPEQIRLQAVIHLQKPATP